MKKSLSILLALCMLIALIPAGALADPVVNGNVINVANAAEAQDVLDGKHGNIDGKTINFTGNIDTVLVLARPMAYEDSNTLYYRSEADYDANNPIDIDWNEDIGTQITTPVPAYSRAVKGVTFTANSGVTVVGFSFSTGHVYHDSHDYVRNQPVTSTNNGYYDYSSIENITFSGLTISGQINFGKAVEGSVSDITIDGCTFTGAASGMSSTAAIRMQTDALRFNNIAVKNCTISNYKQGIYLQSVNGATITNNTISNTTHNAIALQNKADLPVSGTIVIKENFMENVKDRAVRFGDIGSTANISLNNNVMVKCGDENGELIKDVSLSSSAKLNLENNYWDGKEPSKVLTGSFAKNLPTAVGINGGTFTKPILAKYTYTGYAPIRNEDGTYTVVIPGVEQPAAPSSSLPQTGDNSQLAMWFFLLVMSGAAFVLLKRRMANG